MFSTHLHCHRPVRYQSFFRMALFAGAIGLSGFYATPDSSGLHLSSARAEDMLGQDVGKNLQAAQADLSANRFDKAMAAVNMADAAEKKTDYERYVIAQMRAAVAARSGDTKAALAAYDVLIASPRTPKASKGQMLMAEASIAYAAKDYTRAARSAEQYLALIGPSPQMQTVLVQCHYLQQDWAGVAKTARAVLAANEKAGITPPESLLQMLATACGNLHDTNGQTNAYVKLIKYYPRQQYWQILIHDLVSDTTLDPRLVFNVERLRLATNVLTDPADFRDMAERAVQIGLPQLGLNLINEGYAHHILGQGSDAASQAKFRNFLIQQAAKTKAALPKTVQAARTDSAANMSLVAGYNLVLNGQAEQGLALMKAGLGQNPKFPDIAQLDYAMALMDSGRTKDAITAFKAIESEGKVGNVAQLWAAYLAVPSGL